MANSPGAELGRKGTTPREMAEWIVSEWREVRGSDRMLVIAITEALKVIPATVGDLEAEILTLRAALDEVRGELAAMREVLEGTRRLEKFPETIGGDLWLHRADYTCDVNKPEKWCDICKALATPATSLAAHDRALVERCAKAVRDYNGETPIDDYGREVLREAEAAVRALLPEGERGEEGTPVQRHIGSVACHHCLRPKRDHEGPELKCPRDEFERTYTPYQRRRP